MQQRMIDLHKESFTNRATAFLTKLSPKQATVRVRSALDAVHASYTFSNDLKIKGNDSGERTFFSVEIVNLGLGITAVQFIRRKVCQCGKCSFANAVD